MRRVLWVAGAPARAVLLGLIALYRGLISPLLASIAGPRCRFHPTCSAYAEEAVRVHGAAKGVVLAAWRILRCSPLTPGGLDPVPPRGAWPRSAGAGSSGSGLYDDVIQSRGREA
jgi:putative membrane protein insertion efficiency factor